MIKSKKKATIADRVNDALKPKELIEETEENEARYEIFDEHIENNEFSEIRRQNAKNLGEIDSKYQGKAVSRQEIEAEYGNSQSDDDDLLTESDNETDEQHNLSSENESNESDSDQSKDNETDEEMSSGDESPDDYDISEFLNKHTSLAGTSKGTEENTKLVNKQSASDEVKKGVCVQNQLKMWEKLLEVRIKAQKMLITANSFPNFDSFLELSEIDEGQFTDKIDNACDGIYTLMDNLLELQSTLVERFSESKNVLKSCKRKIDDSENGSLVMKKSKLSEYADKIDNNYEAYSKFRNQVLQKWHDRTKSLKDSKNPLTNLNILTKIENALLGKNEVIRKSQIYRGDYDIFGSEIPKNDDEMEQEICIPEVYDDSEFYHQLLRELIEYKSNFGDNQSEITQKFIELQSVRSKMKKRVETRTSKGRKIRYNVHNKLVNFMAPKDSSEWTDEAKTELFNSLFGSANN